jgi:hypothetical protein
VAAVTRDDPALPDEMQLAVVQGNAASPNASRVAQKIRAIRLAGHKRCARPESVGSSGAQVKMAQSVASLVYSSEPRNPGVPRKNLGGWRMAFNGPPRHARPAVIVQPIESGSAAS